MMQKRQKQLFLFLLSISTSQGRKHQAADSFPTNDEYDANLIDPDHLFGAPYGGYARATRSRLAKLPLRLVGGANLPLESLSHSLSGGGGGGDVEGGDTVKREKEYGGDEEGGVVKTSKSPYFQIRDGSGRPFTCRVYHEDELDPSSVTGSVFDAPVLRAQHNKKEKKIAPSPPEQMKKKPRSISTFKAIDKMNKEEAEFEGLRDEDYEDELEGLMENPKSTGGIMESGVPSVAKSDRVQSETRGDELQRQQQQRRRQQQQQKSSNHHTRSQQSPNQQQQQSIKIHPIDIKKQLAKLDGICAQAHQGWWSYEWCFGRSMTQFHISVTPPTQQALSGSQTPKQQEAARRTSNTQTLTIEDVTNLGSYQSQAVLVADPHDLHHRPKKERTSDGSWTGSILIRESFDNGDACDEVGIHRSATVELACCTKKEMKQIYHQVKKMPVKNEKEQLQDVVYTSQDMIDDKDMPLAALLYVREEPNEICVYKAKACTPLLCADQFHPVDVNVVNDGIEDAMAEGGGGGGGVGAAASSGWRRASSSTASSSSMGGTGNTAASTSRSTTQFSMQQSVNKDDSIRTILKKTLGSRCLIRNNGWWTYEFCHARHVGEFHLNTIMNPATGLMKETKEDEHKLGLYEVMESEAFPDEEEADHVVNATTTVDIGGGGSSGGSGQQKKNSAAMGGNGAVYVQEYLHGDVCMDEDVTDFVDGGIERATTVRFSCGKKHEIVNANEDSTCHYIFDVTVPELCDHPLFKAPVIKTQVIKCLPTP